jgi:hypothetical protein
MSLVAATQRLFTVRRFRPQPQQPIVPVAERWIGSTVSLFEEHSTRILATGVLTQVEASVFGYQKLWIDGALWCRWPGQMLVNESIIRSTVQNFTSAASK